MVTLIQRQLLWTILNTSPFFIVLNKAITYSIREVQMYGSFWKLVLITSQWSCLPNPASPPGEQSQENEAESRLQKNQLVQSPHVSSYITRAVTRNFDHWYHLVSHRQSLLCCIFSSIKLIKEKSIHIINSRGKISTACKHLKSSVILRRFPKKIQDI